ncbi:MAG: hypothetical protein RBJ76_13300 [Stenomitos frigidus ULC029]
MVGDREYEVLVDKVDTFWWEARANGMLVSRSVMESNVRFDLDLFLNDPKMYLESPTAKQEGSEAAVADAENRHKQWLDAVLVEVQMMQRFKAAKLAIARQFAEHEQRKPSSVVHQNRSLKWSAWYAKRAAIFGCFRVVLEAEKPEGGYDPSADGIINEMATLVSQSKTIIG